MKRRENYSKTRNEVEYFPNLWYLVDRIIFKINKQKLYAFKYMNFYFEVSS